MKNYVAIIFEEKIKTLNIPPEIKKFMQDAKEELVKKDDFSLEVVKDVLIKGGKEQLRKNIPVSKEAANAILPFLKLTG